MTPVKATVIITRSWVRIGAHRPYQRMESRWEAREAGLDRCDIAIQGSK